MRRALSTVALLALLAAGCSLPTDQEAAVIEADDLPDVLREDFEIVSETPEPGPQTVTVEIYLIDAAGERNIVVPREREVIPQAGFGERIELLFGQEIRTEEEQEFFSNALREFTLLEAFINENDVAVIDMVALDENQTPIDVEADLLRNAAAQLVYTATSFPEVLAVRIRIDGETETLPTSEGDTDEVLRARDYETYDPDFVPPTTTAPPTTAPPTTTTASDEDG